VPLDEGILLEEGRQRDAPLLKTRYLPLLVCLSLAVYHNKHRWRNFWGYEHQWPL